MMRIFLYELSSWKVHSNISKPKNAQLTASWVHSSSMYPSTYSLCLAVKFKKRLWLFFKFWGQSFSNALSEFMMFFFLFKQNMCSYSTKPIKWFKMLICWNCSTVEIRSISIDINITLPVSRVLVSNELNWNWVCLHELPKKSHNFYSVQNESEEEKANQRNWINYVFRSNLI